MSTASALGLTVDDAVVLSDSNRLVVRLKPCDVVARVAIAAPEYEARLAREVEMVRRLEDNNSPVAGLDSRVEARLFMHHDMAVSMWTYFAPDHRPLPPDEYAHALQGLHVGLQLVAIPAPHFMDRIAATEQDVADRELTPDLAEADRSLLAGTLADLRKAIVRRRAPEQLLHGEPHPWNVLNTDKGPLFFDFENSVRGPVEYDLAWTTEAVSERYPGADQDLVDECRGVVLAIVAMHRWRRGDQHPGGRQSGVTFLNAVRQGPPWRPLDTV
jgi:hypothetical protein